MNRGTAVGALIAVGLAGCGGSSHAPAPRRVAESAPALGTVKSRPARTDARKIPVALRKLRTSMTAGLRHVAGPGAVVYDLTSRRTLFERDAQVRRPPASVEKLYTSVALLRRLGPVARLTTRVLGAGHLGHRGVWHGSLYLRGAGDPTFGDGTFNRTWNGGHGPTASQLAAQLAARGIRRVSRSVVGDPTLFDSEPGGPNTDFAPDIPDIGGQLSGLAYDHGAAMGALSPGAFAARELARTMRHVHIKARARKTTAATPSDATQLAAVSSPSLLTMLNLMNVRSDDFFAEMLTKLLGVRFGHGGTTAAGSRVIRSALTRYGIQPTVVDGSGLSRSDRSSPEQVVTLLRKLWHTTLGRELDSTLPVVGVSGTTARIGLHTRAQGRCIAKTGTLNLVTNLAGLCRAGGGHMLAFAVFLDGPTLDQARLLLTRMVGAIASY